MSNNNNVGRRPASNEAKEASEAPEATEQATQTEQAAPVAKEKTKRPKRPTEELISEIGRMRLKRIIEQTVPSDELLAAIEEKNAEAAAIMEQVKDVESGPVKDFAVRLVAEMQKNVNAMREKMANPSTVSPVDSALLERALKLQLKAGRVNIVAVAQAVESCLEHFPVKGTKY